MLCELTVILLTSAVFQKRKPKLDFLLFKNLMSLGKLSKKTFFSVKGGGTPPFPLRGFGQDGSLIKITQMHDEKSFLRPKS